MCLIVTINLGDFLYQRYFPPAAMPPANELKFLSALEIPEKKTYAPKKQKYKIPERAFNPNQYKASDWQKLGFSLKQSEAIVKTRLRRAFTSKEDVRNIFCMPSDYFDLLKDSLILPVKSNEPNEKTKNKDAPGKQQWKGPLDLNSADSLDILKLPGIGPYWTKRILRSRNQWGGFCCINQIASMKGFPDSIFVQIEHLIVMDPLKIKKLNINTISLEEFSKHPAGWYGVAKSVVNYRNQHGDFHSVGDFNKIYSLKPDKIEILRHYVKFNDDN
jgi:DNA uptake protein ComE-like DNA-binding protein